MSSNILRKMTYSGLLSIAFCSVSALEQVFATTLDEVIKRGELIVATEDDYAPFNFITNGKPDGFHKDVLELLRAYAETHGGFKVTQQVLPWTGLLAAVSQGKYDVGLTGALVSPQRVKVIAFAPPIARAQHFYVKRADDQSINAIKDLAEKKVGVQSGSVLEADLPKLAEELKKTGGKLGPKIAYKSYPEAYGDLMNGRVDYVVNLEINIDDAVKKQSRMAKGQALPSFSFIAWPVSKKSPEILQYMSDFLKHITETGELAKIQEKWFGKEERLPQVAIQSPEDYAKLLKEEK